MIGGAQLVKVLGGRWHGRRGHARCPAHHDHTPSLAIMENGDRLLVHCHAGCPQEAVLGALKSRGLWPENNPQAAGSFRRPLSRRSAPTCGSNLPTSGGSDPDDLKRTAAAVEIWKAAQPAGWSHVETYLRSRGPTVPVPPSLRYATALLYTPAMPARVMLPAMVAAVQAPDGKVVAIHRTYLAVDGRGKANVASPKMALGPLGSGAVRLARADETLGLAEGVETALSAAMLFNVPTWAVLGARFAAVELPLTVKRVVLFADNGKAGMKAVNDARAVFISRGLRVAIKPPPSRLGDWNDVLKMQEVT